MIKLSSIFNGPDANSNTNAAEEDSKNILRSSWGDHSAGHWSFPGKHRLSVYLSRAAISFARLRQSLRSKENSTEFFSDYLTHSKEIGRIINNSWGQNESIFDTCEYIHGRLERKKGTDPDLEDIGLARLHFERGYPEIWKAKAKAESRCIGICDDITTVINSYEKSVLEEINKEIQDDNRTIILRAVDPTFAPSSERENFYYRGNILSEIFAGLIDFNRGKEPEIPKSFQVEGKNIDEDGRESRFLTMELVLTSKKLGGGSDKAMKDLKSRYVNLIKHNSGLQNLVKEYSLLKENLMTNQEKSDFYTKINEIWKGIYQDGQKLKGEGVCIKCPHKHFLDYF